MGTSLGGGSDRSLVHRLVARQARENPGALAVEGATGRLGYGELCGRAAALAARLRAARVGRDGVVGVLLDRSPELVVAQLGALAAGAAFLTLDPSHPRERNRFALEDAGARVLITRSDFYSALGAGAWRPLLVDRSAVVSEAPADEATPDDVAYVIYTSGSTGTPKGVAVEHRSLTNLAAWHREAFALTPEDRVAVVAALGFDALVWEIWPALAAGASLHIVDDTTRRSAEGLRDFFVAHGITVAFAPTPLAEAMLDLGWPAGAPLRFLLTGGDRLHRRPPEGLPFTLVNNYGPTECTVVTTSGAVAPGAPGELPSIGRPISGADVLLCDESGRPVADGEEGELCVGGVLLARGYVGRPDLTREKFVPDPDGVPEARVYRTGDRARRRPDGSYDYLGRLDEQVKVRGVRIEPGEVEAALASHPDVAAAAVAARADANGPARLVAWIVPAAGAEPAEEELRRHARERLPDAMIPELFARIAELPLGATGKLDRAALPPPAPSNALRRHTGAAPRTQAQETLAAVVASLLGVTEVGVDDNFFLMGGHSLLGTQVISRVRELFGVQLTLRTLFDAPTVAQLCGEIERRRSTAA